MILFKRNWEQESKILLWDTEYTTDRHTADSFGLQAYNTSKRLLKEVSTFQEHSTAEGSW